MDNNDGDSEEDLRFKTQQLVEMMKLKQKGLSRCLQETLEVLSSSEDSFFSCAEDSLFEKAAIFDKTQDAEPVRGQSRDILVRSFDLTQQDSARQKLVALAKRHPKENSFQTPTSDSTSEVGDSSCVQITDQDIVSDLSSQKANVSQASENPAQAEHSDVMDHLEVCESPIDPSSDSEVVETLPDSDLETLEKITPNSVNRRRIIDKNVKVDSGEILDHIEQDCDPGLGLNYSYSDIESDSGSVCVKGFLSDSDCFDELDCVENGEKSQRSLLEEELPATNESAGEKSKTSNYKDILSDQGNLKRTKKPILTRTAQSKNRWLTGRTALNNRCSKTESLKSKEHKLLGYDWIASVLDNKGETSLEISDDHFEELRNFWQEQQGRPINDLNLLKKYVDDSEEPQLIQDILAKSKIQNYRINNRLFPELVRKKNISGREDDVGIENRQPAFDSPRFVSVTVPNNTIEANSVKRSHRRGSVDSSESLSLGKHCILGWESSCVNVPTTGTTLSMKDATTGSRVKQVLTLDEAEALASRPRRITRFFADKTNISDPNPPKGKTTTKSKQSDFLKRVIKATNPPETLGPNSSVQSTSELLDSAYSLMRDLDRIKHERSMKRLAMAEQGGVP